MTWDSILPCGSFFLFFLTHLVSITHSPFQATTNMTGGSGADDYRAGLPPEDKSNASRFCRDAESAMVAASGAELGRGGVQLSSAAVDGFARVRYCRRARQGVHRQPWQKIPWTAMNTMVSEQLLRQLR